MLKQALVLKHIAIEGPGTLGDFLIKKGINLTTIELYKEDLYLLSINLKEFIAVIILGGPMNVYEEDKYPFLKWENNFIKEVLRADMPLLGICLGAQLIAKAAGGKISKAPKKELGWFEVALEKETIRDRLFRGVEDNLRVFQWHEDTFTLPAQAVLLSRSNQLNQAFRIGQAYGFQFHIEVNAAIIKDWINYYFPKAKAEYAGMLADFNRNQPQLESQRNLIYQNFLSLILPKN